MQFVPQRRSNNEHGDTVQTINTLCPISGTVVEIYDNLIVISDDDAETDDDRLEFHVDDLEVA